MKRQNIRTTLEFMKNNQIYILDFKNALPEIKNSVYYT